MIFNFYIFDKNGTCLFYREWNRKRKHPKGEYENDFKLMYGLIYSLCQFVIDIAPKTGEGLQSYKTDAYKLHFFVATTR